MHVHKYISTNIQTLLHTYINVHNATRLNGGLEIKKNGSAGIARKKLPSFAGH